MPNRWDITKAKSDYHFNAFMSGDHGKYFRTVGNIYDEWESEVEYAVENEYDFYWPAPVRKDGKTIGDKEETFEYSFEEALCEDWGIPKDYVVYRQHVVDENTPILNSLAEKVGLIEHQTNIQTQHTGMMLHLHIDSLTGLRMRKNHEDQDDDRDQWGRCFVMLHDWMPGHIMQFGNTYVPPWKSGDILWFDWKNVPHSTANTGPWSRSIAKITGKVTDKYKELINNG
jgi:hypothetical protein